MPASVGIRVHLCRTGMIRQAEELLASLPEPLQQQGARFRKKSSQVNFAVSRLLLAKALEACPSILALLERTAMGKPFIPGYPGFSLTHTQGLVAVAVAESVRVGLDAEEIRSMDLDDFENYLTFQEKEEINHSSSRFLEIWTAKEAAMKAAGTGLQEPLAAAVVKKGSVAYTGVEWHLQTLDISGFIVSLCSDFRFSAELSDQTGVWS